MGDLDKRTGPTVDRMVGGASGATVSLLAALVMGPEAAAIMGNAFGPLVEEASYAVRRVALRRGSKIEAAGDAACHEGQCTLEDLVDEAVGDDRKLELIARALEAAARAEEDRKIDALGRSLARGVLTNDDARVDEELRITTALASLEPADMRALSLMEDGTQWIKRHPTNDDDNWANAWTESDPGLNSVIDSIVARLTTHGLISDESIGGLRFGGSSWHITEFGRACINTLRLRDQP